MKKLVWVRGRFSWLLVAFVAFCTCALLFVDWYWRTHETHFSLFF
jgi:hypothetical protein